jgi:hypothetical protein
MKFIILLLVAAAIVVALTSGLWGGKGWLL